MGRRDLRPRHQQDPLARIVPLGEVGGVCTRHQVGVPVWRLWPRNFPFGCLPPFEPVDPWVVTSRERWEDREAREHLAAEQAGEAYMAKLRQR